MWQRFCGGRRWSVSPECLAFVQVRRSSLSPGAAESWRNVEGLKYPGAGDDGEGRDRHAAGCQEIWELLLELSMSRMRARFLTTITELGLSFPQAHALKVLRPATRSPCGTGRTGSTVTSNITGIVDRLGDRGLVERGAAPGDRRVKTLMLTEEGTALRMRLLDRLSEPPPGLGKLPVDEQRQLRDLLRRALLD